MSGSSSLPLCSISGHLPCPSPAGYSHDSLSFFFFFNLLDWIPVWFCSFGKRGIYRKSLHSPRRRGVMGLGQSCSLAEAEKGERGKEGTRELLAPRSCGCRTKQDLMWDGDPLPPRFWGAPSTEQGPSRGATAGPVQGAWCWAPGSEWERSHGRRASGRARTDTPRQQGAAEPLHPCPPGPAGGVVWRGAASWGSRFPLPAPRAPRGRAAQP